MHLTYDTAQERVHAIRLDRDARTDFGVQCYRDTGTWQVHPDGHGPLLLGRLANPEPAGLAWVSIGRSPVEAQIARHGAVAVYFVAGCWHLMALQKYLSYRSWGTLARSLQAGSTLKLTGPTAVLLPGQGGAIGLVPEPGEYPDDERDRLVIDQHLPDGDADPDAPTGPPPPLTLSPRQLCSLLVRGARQLSDPTLDPLRPVELTTPAAMGTAMGVRRQIPEKHLLRARERCVRRGYPHSILEPGADGLLIDWLVQQGLLGPDVVEAHRRDAAMSLTEAGSPTCPHVRAGALTAAQAIRTGERSGGGLQMHPTGPLVRGRRPQHPSL